jgi:hypothetical protein
MTEQQPPDNRPSWLINIQAVDTHPMPVTIDGVAYQYTIVKKGLVQELPYAVGFPSDDILMISEDVPIEERVFILTHEVREKKKFDDLPQEQRCKAALQQELDDVKMEHPERYQEYVLRRKDFFDSLVNFYQQAVQAQAVTPELRTGIQSSRDYLHEIATGFK